MKNLQRETEMTFDLITQKDIFKSLANNFNHLNFFLNILEAISKSPFEVSVILFVHEIYWFAII